MFKVCEYNPELRPLKRMLLKQGTATGLNS